MTTFKPARGKTYRYDFWFRNERYLGNTKQLTKADADLVEREIQLKLRHHAGGIAQFYPEETPRFQDWAEVFLVYKRARLTRPDHVEHLTRVLLRFWGAPSQPGDVRTPATPFHDRRLGDPIADASWILRFEEWLAQRGLGNQSKNHYRGMLRRMYAVARLPAYRQMTGVTSNPFLEIERDPTTGRTVALAATDVQRWIAASSYHVRLAIAVAALAPKLRLANILALRWSSSFDPDPRTTKFDPRVAHYLVVQRHKTAITTKRPLVSPITAQLLRILKDVWARQREGDVVIRYRGQAIKSIRHGVKAAAEECGIPYGRSLDNGATFHTLRHTAATLLSNVEADPLKLRDAMGHTDLTTTMRYRHRRPTQERPSLERLSRTLALEKLVTTRQMRATRTKATVAGQVQGPRSATAQNRPKISTFPQSRRKA